MFAITTLLRLSSKYVAEDMFNEIVDFLAVLFPSDLKAFDHALTFQDRYKTLFNFDSDYFHLLDAVHQVSVKKLLPAIYLRCIYYDLDWIVEYIHDEDSEIPIELSMNIITGREKFFFEVACWVLQALEASEVSDACKSLDCELNFDGVGLRYRNLLAKLFGYSDELERLTPNYWADFLGGTGAMCGVCRETFRKKLESGRETLWSKLPGYFGLEPWHKLKGEA